jgi:hypothetical protein
MVSRVTVNLPVVGLVELGRVERFQGRIGTTDHQELAVGQDQRRRSTGGRWKAEPAAVNLPVLGS